MKLPRPPKLALTKKTFIISTAIALVVALAAAFLCHYFSSNGPVGFSLATTNKPTFAYKCNGDPESILCLEQTYSQYTQQKGVAAAFVKLKAAYTADPAIHTDCHVLA